MQYSFSPFLFHFHPYFQRALTTETPSVVDEAYNNIGLLKRSLPCEYVMMKYTYGVVTMVSADYNDNIRDRLPLVHKSVTANIFHALYSLASLLAYFCKKLMFNLYSALTFRCTI